MLQALPLGRFKLAFAFDSLSEYIKISPSIFARAKIICTVKVAVYITSHFCASVLQGQSALRLSLMSHDLRNMKGYTLTDYLDYYTKGKGL